MAHWYLVGFFFWRETNLASKILHEEGEYFVFSNPTTDVIPRKPSVATIESQRALYRTANNKQNRITFFGGLEVCVFSLPHSTHFSRVICLFEFLMFGRCRFSKEFVRRNKRLPFSLFHRSIESFNLSRTCHSELDAIVDWSKESRCTIPKTAY